MKRLCFNKLLKDKLKDNIMAVYQRQGKVPHKRHIVFRKPNGELYHEELFGTEGFAGVSSLLYHLYPPTMVEEIRKPYSVKPEIAVEDNITAMSFLSFDVIPESDYISSRKVMFFNNDIAVGVAAPTESMNSYFFKNADADELIFVHKGSGVMKTAYGSVEFEYGDYLVIPRGTVYQFIFNDSENKLLITESYSPIKTPKRYTNDSGQFLEHSPFCERDFKVPTNLETHDEMGRFEIRIKKKDVIYSTVYQSHPFDLIGWDGCNYPYAFSIFNFEPITGRIHMPPPIHQTFEGAGFVICSFVPRLYDYHPDAIPAPYHHSNIDSDELLYYVDGDFMSRNNIQKRSNYFTPCGSTSWSTPRCYRKKYR